MGDTAAYEARIHREKSMDGRVGYWTRDEVVAMDNRALARLVRCHPRRIPASLRLALSPPVDDPLPEPEESPADHAIAEMRAVVAEVGTDATRMTCARQVALFLLGERFGAAESAAAFGTIQESVRAARSKLARFVAARALTIEPTKNCFAELFAAVFEEEQPVRPTRKALIKLCAATFGVPEDDIMSSRRTRRVVWPRQVAMFLCKRFTLSSYPEIGRSFGGRDHTTVLHAYRKMDEYARAFNIDGGDDPSAWATAFAKHWSAP